MFLQRAGLKSEKCLMRGGKNRGNNRRRPLVAGNTRAATDGNPSSAATLNPWHRGSVLSTDIP